MKIYLRYGGVVMTPSCAFLDPYMLIVDEDEKTIEINDNMGMVEGIIYYENEKYVDINRRNENNRLLGDVVPIVKDGEVIYKEE